MTNESRPGSAEGGPASAPTESDQIVQRRANIEGLKALGVDLGDRVGHPA